MTKQKQSEEDSEQKITKETRFWSPEAETLCCLRRFLLKKNVSVCCRNQKEIRVIHLFAAAVPRRAVGDTKLLGDLGQVYRRAFIMLRGCPRNDLQIGDFR